MLNLSSYSNDEYLSCLFGQDRTLFEMWIMDWGKASARVPILVYAMISIADKGQPASYWTHSEFRIIASDQYAKKTIARIAKASIVDTGVNIVSIILGLLQGQSLQLASLNSHCPTPPTKFGQINLGTKLDIEKQFVVRPPVTSLSQEGVLRLSELNQGSSSPQRSTIARVGSIFRIDKQALWLDQSNKVLPKAHIILREITTTLSSQTGMRFVAGDAKRLGNIEFFSFPTTDYRGQSRVTIESEPEPIPGGRHKSCRRIVVKLSPEALIDGTSILINCRLLNDNEVIADECKESIVPVSSPFLFDASEQVSAGEVRIWCKSHGASSWILWYQENFNLFRSFSVSTILPEIPRSDWLDKLKDSTTKTRDHRDPTVSGLAAFDTYSSSIDSFFSQDPWNPIGARMVNLCKRLTAPRSSASFFLPMDGNEPARIRKLSDWLEQRRDKYVEAGTCVIMDPFFDEAGAEVVRLARFKNTEMIIITNSQCRSIDDQATESCFINATTHEEEPNRASRIRSYFEKYASDFRKKAVRVLDIRSHKHSTRQYFHDRYVLVFRMDGRLERGFNLSNSLQGAMKSYPLLITEMPFDMLEPIQCYFEDFITDCATSQYRKIVTLFSSYNESVHERSRAPEGLQALTDPACLYAQLFSEKKVRGLNIEELKDYLREFDLIGEDNSFKLPTFIQKAILEVALSKNSEEFRKYWKNVSEIMARSHDTDNLVASIPQNHDILAKIEEFLVDDEEEEDNCVTNLQNKAVRSAAYLADLCYSQDFSHCLKEASHISRHTISMSTYKYDIHEAVATLRTVEPMRLVKVIEKITAPNPTTRRKYVAIKAIEELSLIFAFTSSYTLFFSIASSQNQLIRAMAAMNWFHKEFESGRRPDLLWVETNFTPHESVMVLAEWVYELRIYANRNGNLENHTIRIWRESAFEYMRNKWPAAGDTAFLKYVLGRVGGPTDSWACSTYNDLAVPLSDAGFYTLSDLRDYWYGQLVDKIESLKKDGHFFASSDIPLTGNAAHAIVNEGSRINESLDEMKARLDECVVQLLRPRIQTTEYDTWIKNTWIVLWIQSFLEHLLFYKNRLSTHQQEKIATVIAKGDSHTFDRDDVMSQESYELVVWAKKVRYAERNSALK